MSDRTSASFGLTRHVARAELALAWLATAFALVLVARFWSEAGGLWRDEVNSVALASAPSAADVFRLGEFDSFPPPWAFLLRGWIALFGQSDAALRTLGALGGASIVAALWLGARSLGRGAPCLALALLAVQPEALRWASTVRAFGFGASLSLVALAALLRAVETPSRGRVLAALAASVLAAQLVYQNVVYVALAAAAAFVHAFLVGAPRRTWIPIAAGGLAAASVAPYASIVARVGEWNGLVREDVTLASLWTKLMSAFGDTQPVVVAIWALALVAAAVCAARATLAKRAEPSAERDARVLRGRSTVGGALALVVPLALLGFYLELGYTTESWYYVGVFVTVAFCVEVALAAAETSVFARAATVGLALLALACGASRAWQALGVRQTNVDELAKLVSSEVRAGDVVVVVPWYLALPFDRYYTGTAEVLTAPPLEDRSLHRYDLLKRSMQERDAMAPVLERASRALSSGGRVWIVGELMHTAPGTPRLHLEPPPRPDTGWNCRFDLLAWNTALGDHLDLHCATLTQVHAPAPGSVRDTEAAPLFVAQGFRP